MHAWTASVAFTVAMIVGVVAAMAQAPPMGLSAYKCVPQTGCGLVSTVCWGDQHPYGSQSNTCTFCDGIQKQDLCERALLLSTCPWTGQSQTCGYKYQGTCSPAGVQLGTCSGTTPLGVCTVPKC